MREPFSATTRSPDGLKQRNIVKTALLLVDDHSVVLEGLRALIKSQEDMEVVGEACNGSEAARMAKELRPDVVLMDLLMPKLNGIETMRQILRQNPSSHVLVLTSSGNASDVNEALDAGAAGYVIKQTASVDLFTAIRQVRRGQPFFSPSISKRLPRQHDAPFRKKENCRIEIEHLTPRETQVLRLIAAGQSNKMIADILGISIKTVEKHRQQLMDKTNVHEVAGLTRYAIGTGFIEPPADAEAAVAPGELDGAVAADPAEPAEGQMNGGEPHAIQTAWLPKRD